MSFAAGRRNLFRTSHPASGERGRHTAKTATLWHALTLALLTVVTVALTACGGNPVTAHLGSLTAGSSTFQSGQAATLVLPGGFAGLPTAGSTTVTMVAQGGGTSYKLTVTGITPSGGNYLLNVTLPSLDIKVATTYLFSASGTTTTGSFDTNPPLTQLVQPGPQISALNPSTGQQGQTLDVAVTGVGTSWVNGTTTASFGASVTVASVAVTSGTALTAHVVIAANATTGTRDVTITTGSQVLTLPAAFTVAAAPKPPVASAGGPYTATTGVPVTLSAAASTDPAGLPLTYAWTFGDGGTATGATPSHTYAASGTYAATVVVTNSAGASSSASASVTVKDAPKPPVANAGGPYTATTGVPLTLSAAASNDPAGLPLTYAWTFGDGGTATGVTPSHTYAASGTYTATVVATSSAGLSSSATANVVVKDAPKAPVANAGGPYTAKAGDSVTFSGAASSDPQGETLTYSWDFGDGSAKATGVAPTHTYSSAGTYTVTLTVTNTDNLSNTQTATATITAVAVPPVANAGGPYTGTAGTAVNFSGAASSDANGQTLTYSWDFGDSSAKATGVAPTHIYQAAGTYTVTLTVTNSDGLSGTATTTAVIAAAPPQPPVAISGGPYTGQTGAALTFTAAGSSDPKGEALTYAWDFGDGQTGTGVTVAHTYAAAGTFTVTLTVTNTDHLTTSATTTATITPAAQAPLANAGGSYTGVAGAAVSFNGTGSSDPRGETLSYSWDFGDSSAKSTLVSPQHTYAAAGTYTVTLTVTNTDNLQAVSTTSAVITAAPQPPVANAGGPYTGVAGTALTFTAAASTDPKSEPLTYSWNFGDGGTGTGVNPTHTYASAGTYTATVTVLNSDGLSGSASALVTISAAPNQPPVANAGSSYTGIAGVAISFSGAGSSDPKGEALTYAWQFGDGATATGVAPTHAYAAAGTYTVTLTVTNTDGLSGTATTTATVGAVVTQPPVANAGGPYTSVAGTMITFSAAGSTDPKGEALTYAWNFGDSSSATGVTPTHTYAAAGTYTITLTVTNTDGLSGSAQTTATITPAPQPPVASVGGPYTGTAGVAVSFTAAGSTDPKNEALTYSWNFGDGANGTGVAPTHTYATAGTYTVSVTVSNTDGLSATASTTATIAAAAQPPVAVAGGPYTGTTGTAVNFSAAGSNDPKNEALTYAWSFGDGSTGTGVSPTHTYAATGTFAVTVTVTNTDGLSATASTTAAISAPAAQPPVASAGGPYTGTAGSLLSFSAAASTDPKGETLTYTWKFGDGAVATGVTPTHIYTAAGTYTVTVTVTNTDSASSSASTTATISAAPVGPPTAYPGGVYSGTAGQAILLNGADSTDPAAGTKSATTTLTYAWNFGDGTTGAGPTPLHSYTTAGTYTVTLTVTSTSGQSNTAQTTATIVAGPPATGTVPVVNAGGPYSATVGQPVTLTGSATDTSGDTLSYIWSFGDGQSADGATVTHTYTTSGTFSPTLSVHNSTNGAQASAVVTVAPSAAAGAPVARAGGPYTASINLPVTLDGTQTTNPGNRILTYTWDFGDASAPGTSATPSHTYTAQGTYTVSLTVSDGQGNTSNASTQVTVGGPPAEAITANAGGPYNDVTGHTVIFDGTRSADNLGNALTYTWDFGDGTSATGATPGHAYSSNGTFTAKLTVSSNGMTQTATAVVTITPQLNVAITSPTASAIFGTNTITVSGTVSSPNLTVTVNGIPATVTGTNFTATGVSLREGVNLIAATATDGNGGVGTGSISVVLDATAPTVSITSPAANATVSTASITVAGLVNDIVTGTIGATDVTVTVNGIKAAVANRSYEALGILLSPGANTITVVATDNVGHSSTVKGTVNYVPATAQLSLRALSGNGQGAVVASVLSQPLVVQLLAADGTPVAGRPVTFTVTRSDGQVEVMPTIAQSLFVNTDASGKASVLFQLGSRAGLGVNQVTASTPGAAGTVLFTEDTTAGPPAQIHPVRGEAQRGLIGEALAEAFQVIVTDAQANPVPGVAVNWSSVTGDGTLSAQSSTTDANGKTLATLTLGQQEGINNYVVSANFTGATGAPIIFSASGYAPGPVANTSVSGVVLDNANMPIPNATVRLLNTTLSTVTDANGRFAIPGAPVGIVTLSVDGSTSTRTETFPFLSFLLEDLPGQNNTLNKPVYLPFINVNSAQTVGGDDPVTLTMDGVPGVAFTIAPHSVVFPDGTTVGKLSLSQVKSDMVPMPPNNGAGPDLIWTLQPAGTRFSVPVQVTLPNTQHLAPGVVSEFYQYDHDLEQFVSAGTAHVSADGSVMVSDPGFGITKAGWGHGPTTPPPPNCTVSCQSYLSQCVGLTPFNCGCLPTPLPGRVCGNTPDQLQCKQQGICNQWGGCVADNKPDNTVCGKDTLCTTHKCKGGECQETTVPDRPQGALGDTAGNSGNQVAFQLQKVSSSIGDFLKTLGVTVEIRPKINQALTTTLHCCEERNIPDSPILEQNITGSIEISGPEFPLNLPVPPYTPLGITLPRLGFQGVFGQFTGSIGVGFTHKTDFCPTPTKDCVYGTASIGVGGKIGINFTVAPDIFKTTLSISAGITGSITGGCGSLKSTIAFTGLVANGEITVLDLINYPVSQTLVGATTISEAEYKY